MPPTSGPVRLAETREEWAELDPYADLYSLLQTLEAGEKAHLRGTLSAELYEPQCRQLLRSYKNAHTVLKDKGFELDKFIEEYQLRVPYAKIRIQEGRPPTAAAVGGLNPSLVGAVTESFITLLDILRLGSRASENAATQCQDLLIKLERAAPELSGIEHIKRWWKELDGWEVSREFPEATERQMLHDVEKVYASWNGWLAQHGQG